MNTTFSKLLAIGLVVSSLPLVSAAPTDRAGGRMGRRQQQAGGAPMTQPGAQMGGRMRRRQQQAGGAPMAQPGAQMDGEMGGQMGRRRQQASNFATTASGNHLSGRIKEIRGDFLLIEWSSDAPDVPTAPAMGGRRRGAGRRGAAQGFGAPAAVPGGVKITRVRLAALRNFVRHTRGSRADLVKGAHIMALASPQGDAYGVQELTVQPPSVSLTETDLQSRFQAARFVSPNSPISFAAHPFEGDRLVSGLLAAPHLEASVHPIAGRRGARRRNGLATGQVGLSQPGMLAIEISGQLVSSFANEATIQTSDGREVKLSLAPTTQPMVLREMSRQEFRVGQSVAVGWNQTAVGRAVASDGVDEIAQPSVLMLSDALASTVIGGTLQNTAPTESASKSDRLQKKLDKAEQKELEKSLGDALDKAGDKTGGTIKGNGGQSSGSSTSDTISDKINKLP